MYQLNKNQQEAVNTVDKNLCIIAGAGSGKTSVVTQRIAHLITNHQIKDYRILAITFTNRAAKEMKERIIKQIPNSNIQAMTIHAFCVRFLREEIKHLHYPNSFAIVDVDDQKRIIQNIVKDKKIDIGNFKVSEIINYISNNKMEDISTSEAYQYAHVEHQKLFAFLYEKYELRLQQLKSLDFNDLLLFTHKLLKNDEIRHKWQNRYSFIHVDEFQDVDYIQYQIIKQLINENNNLCVVGDPDQCIYTWRGAKINYILEFEENFSNSKTIILNENYRSTPEILNAANSLINQNKNRIKKDLITHNPNGVKVQHYSGGSESEENAFIIRKIQEIKQETDYKNIAILYRSNFLSRSIEKSLMDARIPYVIKGNIRFFERSEIKDAIAYLRLLLDNESIDLALERVINVPKRGVGEKTLDQIRALSINENVRMYDVVLKMVETNKSKQNITQFIEMIEKYREKLNTLSIHKTLGLLLAESGYYAMLQDNNEEERLENIKSFIQDIAVYEEENQNATLENYLQEIMLYLEKEDGTSSAVTLLSVHAAKGNEFDYVFIYQFSEGIFPNEKAIMEGLLEEERRIAYVAMTRAKKQLFLCESRGFTFNKDRIKTTSRFIHEIDDYYIQSANVSIPKSSNKIVSTNIKINKGDKVFHSIFGNGIVVNMDMNIATIAFPSPHGIKKILATHPSLQKR